MCCHCDSSRSPSDGGAAPSPDQKNESKEPGKVDGEPPKVPADGNDPKSSPPQEDGKANGKSSESKTPPKTPPKQPTTEDIEKNGKEPSPAIKAKFPNMKEIKVYGNDVYARNMNGDFTLIGRYDDKHNFFLDKNMSGKNLGFHNIAKTNDAFHEQFPEIINRENVYVAPDGSVYERLSDGTWKHRGHVDPNTYKRDDTGAPK